MKPRQALAALVAYKVLLYGFIYLSTVFLTSLSFNIDSWATNFHWPDTMPSPWLRLKTWDAQHYLYLSHQGYSPGHPSNNFFPLWPFLIRIFSYVTLGNHFLSALVLVNAFSLAGLFFFYKLAVEKDGEKAALHSLALLLAFPAAFVLLVPYSEALFLCLAGGFFLALKKQKYWAASVLCGLMTLARPVGIFLLLPLVWELWQGKKMSRWACLLIPAAALAAYFAIMRHYTGDAFAFFEAQSHYIAHADLARLAKPGQFLKTLFCLHPVWHDYLNSVVDRSWFFVFAGSLFFLWRYDRTYFWYSLPMGLVPAATNCFASYTRYFFTVFPIFMMAGNHFSKGRSKWIYGILVFALFLLQILFLLRHINNDWAV